MESLQLFRLFSKTVEMGSFSSAGRHVGLSTASVSRGVAALENSLGVQLINRGTRQCSPTEAGKLLFLRLQTVFADLQDATESVKSFQSTAKGMLYIHARTALGELCIAPALPAFLEKNPKLSVRLSLSNDNSLDLIKNNIDIDLRTGTLPDSVLISKKLTTSRRLLVATPDYLLAHGCPQHPSDLALRNCLTFRVNDEECIWRFKDKNGQVIDFRPKGSVESDSGAALRIALMQGLGIAHMTDWAVAEQVRSGQLIQVLPDYPVTIGAFGHGVYALYTKSRHSSPKVRAFLDFFSELFRTKRFRLDEPVGATPSSALSAPASTPVKPNGRQPLALEARS